LVLSDARTDPRFRESPAVIERGVRSLLCCPIAYHGVFIGALYLESTALTAAFSPSRVRAVNLIASEVAGAIHSYRLQSKLSDNDVALQWARRKVELLEKSKAQLSHFVPHTVRRIIEANPEAPALTKAECDVSVLFLDIEGYTALSERLELAKVDQLIELYFSAFLDIVHENEGDINETAGDGLMIVFQHAEACVHAQRAVQTALAILEKTNRLNERLAGTSDAVLVNIGINSGSASLGSNRFVGATGKRYTYTASGPVTNLAARLAAYASGGAALLSAETASRVCERFRVKNLGQRSFKNVGQPVAVFRLGP